MPTIGSITKTIRINAGDLAVFESIMSNGTSWSGAVHELCKGYGGTPSKNEKIFLPTADIKEIESMAKFFQMELSDFLHGVCEGLTEGNLTVENGMVVGTPEIDLDDFKEACGSKDPQKVLNDITRKIRSGLL